MYVLLIHPWHALDAGERVKSSTKTVDTKLAATVDSFMPRERKIRVLLAAAVLMPVVKWPLVFAMARVALEPEAPSSSSLLT